MAKGVRKTKSRFGGRLEPLTHVSLLLYQGRELDVVSQAESLDHFRALHDDLSRLTRGIALLEAVDQLAQEREPNLRLYQMLLGALRALTTADSPLAGGGVLLEAAGRRGPAPRAGRLRGVRLARAVRGLRPRPGRRAVPRLPPRHADQRRRPRAPAPGPGRRPGRRAARDPSAATHEVDTLAVAALEHHIERRLRAVGMLGQV